MMKLSLRAKGEEGMGYRSRVRWYSAVRRGPLRRKSRGCDMPGKEGLVDCLTSASPGQSMSHIPGGKYR